jgi:hypothetical protein
MSNGRAASVASELRSYETKDVLTRMVSSSYTGR